MKLSDLRTGMIVTTRDGREWCVLKDFECAHKYAQGTSGIIVHAKNEEKSWEKLSAFVGMKHPYLNGKVDIVKVELVSHPYGLFDLEYERENRKLLWQEEPEIKEVTMSEVEEKFGCKVKIVGG